MKAINQKYAPILFVTTIALFAGGAACVAPTGSDDQDVVAAPPPPPDDEAYFIDDDTLGVDFEHSPSGGTDFDFCMEPGGDSDLNLKNAAWLGWMAANEYAHLGYIAPALSTLGFGNDGAGDLLWVKCANDLRQVRDFEKSRPEELQAEFAKGPESFLDYLSHYTSDWAFEERWGTCAVNWFEESGYDGKKYPAAAFEEFLIQTPAENQYIQFFSGGEYAMDTLQFEKGSTQVMYARHGELPLAIVSFRGTEADKWQDITTDGDFWRIKLENEGWPEEWGKMHRGFYNAFDAIAGERLMSVIAGLRGTGVQIYLTGHSLGGALATVMAARIMKDMEAGADYNFKGVYTFGSPRVGNTDFQDKFEDTAEDIGLKVIRFRNEKDVVTTVPKFLWYRHVGTVTYLEEDLLDYDDDPSFNFTLSGADHSITGYGENFTPKSGYYRRVLKHMNDPQYDAYDVCGDTGGGSGGGNK